MSPVVVCPLRGHCKSLGCPYATHHLVGSRDCKEQPCMLLKAVYGISMRVRCCEVGSLGLAVAEVTKTTQLKALLAARKDPCHD